VASVIATSRTKTNPILCDTGDGLDLTMSAFIKLIRARLYPPPDPTGISLAGKTVLLTGATSGLGFQAALKYLNLGVKSLIIGSRDLERGRRAQDELEKCTNRRDVVQTWHLDLRTFKSVLQFTERVNNEVSRLDIVLLNAGVFHREYHVSPDGWEDTLQVNTLSTALLALQLLPKLRESSASDALTHLTIVSSAQFTRVKEERLWADGNLVEHLNNPTRFKGPTQYGISKLLIEYIVRHIAEITTNEEGSLQMIVNTASPGFCQSQLGRDFNRFYERWVTAIIYRLFGRTAEQGSRSLVSSTLQGAESHGKCWKGDGYLE